MIRQMSSRCPECSELGTFVEMVDDSYTINGSKNDWKQRRVYECDHEDHPDWMVVSTEYIYDLMGWESRSRSPKSML